MPITIETEMYPVEMVENLSVYLVKPNHVWSKPQKFHLEDLGCITPTSCPRAQPRLPPKKLTHGRRPADSMRQGREAKGLQRAVGAKPAGRSLLLAKSEV